MYEQQISSSQVLFVVFINSLEECKKVMQFKTALATAETMFVEISHRTSEEMLTT